MKQIPLKPKERAFVKALVKNNLNASEAVRQVYGTYEEKYTRVKGHRLITKSNIAQAIVAEQESLKSALQKVVSPEKIARKINQLLDDEDANAIDKGLKHATNIYGVEDLDKAKTNNTYNFLFNVEAQREIKEIEQRIKERLLNVKPTEENNKAE